jgi:hypothetical protein
MATENAHEWSRARRAVEQEHDRMVESGVWVAVPLESILPGEKILTSTWWAMKKKSNVLKLQACSVASVLLKQQD